jgi:hypothetical protein
MLQQVQRRYTNLLRQPCLEYSGTGVQALHFVGRSIDLPINIASSKKGNCNTFSYSIILNV